MSRALDLSWFVVTDPLCCNGYGTIDMLISGQATCPLYLWLLLTETLAVGHDQHESAQGPCKTSYKESLRESPAALSDLTITFEVLTHWRDIIFFLRLRSCLSVLLSALFVCVGASALDVIHEASDLHWRLLKDKASSLPSVLALG